MPYLALDGDGIYAELGVSAEFDLRGGTRE